jgi:DNA-binding CsgD family transcriptional regulator
VWVAARLAEATGDRPRALALVAPLFDTLAARRRLLVDEPAAAAWLTRLALAVNGDGQGQAQARAAAVVTCAEQLAAANPGFPTLAASAAHARGLLDQDPVLVARAAAGHRHLWARASAWEDLGLLLADRGERANARRALDEARRTYGELGAAADAARVDGRLEGMRARRPRRPVMGWGSLTDTERRVAHVVAQGLTNAQAAERLFLSRHTVDFHLRQIFQKLAIGSRVELTRVVLGRHPVCDR